MSRTPAVVTGFNVEVFPVPLLRPFVTSLGSKTESWNVGLTLKLKGGSTGYGEASSSLALAHLKPGSLARTLHALARSAVGADAGDAKALVEKAWKEHGSSPPAVSAFEAALLEASLGARGTDLAAWLGGRLPRVESDITLSAWDPQTTAEAAAQARAEGFRTLKIKVGGDLRESMERIRAALRGTAGRRRPAVILDGNQGMTARGALRLVEACLREGIALELLEQPLLKSDRAGMAAVTRRCPVPVAADEAVMTPEDAVRTADARSASVINIKLAKSGIFRGLEIAAVARAAGLELMIGCMAESGRGLTSSVLFALGTGFFRYIDLDSDHLHRPVRPPGLWRRKGPELSLRRPER